MLTEAKRVLSICSYDSFVIWWVRCLFHKISLLHLIESVFENRLNNFVEPNHCWSVLFFVTCKQKSTILLVYQSPRSFPVESNCDLDFECLYCPCANSMFALEITHAIISPILWMSHQYIPRHKNAHPRVIHFRMILHIRWGILVCASSWSSGLNRWKA